MATYPGGVYAPRTKENKAGVIYDPTEKTTCFVEDVTYLDAEVVAIETDLIAKLGQALLTSSSPQFVGLTLTGALNVQGDTTLGNAATDLITVNGKISQVVTTTTTAATQLCKITHTLGVAGTSGRQTALAVSMLPYSAQTFTDYVEAANFTVRPPSAGASLVGLFANASAYTSAAGNTGAVSFFCNYFTNNYNVAAHGIVSGYGFYCTSIPGNTNQFGVHVESADNANYNCTTWIGVDIAALTGTTKVDTNRYGLKIGNISGASTLNYSIYTGTGLVYLGGNVEIIGTLSLSSDTTVTTGKKIKTDTTTAHTMALQGYSTLATNYVDVILITNGVVPTIDLYTSATIGGRVIYSVGSTDVAVADGGTGHSAWTQYAIPYLSTTTAFSEIAVGPPFNALVPNAGANGYEWLPVLKNVGCMYTIVETINYNTASPSLIFTTANGYVIQDVYAEIITTWDGTGTFTVGDSGDNDGFLTVNNITFGTLGYYGSIRANLGGVDDCGDYLAVGVGFGYASKRKIYTSSSSINAYITPGTSTKGTAKIYVVVQRLK